MKGHQPAGRYTTAGHLLGGLPSCPILGAALTDGCGLGIVLVPAFEHAVGLVQGTTHEQQTDQREYASHFPVPPVHPSAPAHTLVFYTAANHRQWHGQHFHPGGSVLIPKFSYGAFQFIVAVFC